MFAAQARVSVASAAMRLLFVGGTGPVGVAACRAATERRHHVIVAHTGAHELPNDIDAEHFHGAREELHERIRKVFSDYLDSDMGRYVVARFEESYGLPRDAGQDA